MKELLFTIVPLIISVIIVPLLEGNTVKIILCVALGISVSIVIHFIFENKKIKSKLERKAHPECGKSLFCKPNFDDPKKVPTKFKSSNKLPQKNTFIYSDIDSAVYSSYSKQVAEEKDIKDIFTVFAVNPVIIFRTVVESLVKNNKNAKIDLYDDSQLLEYIRNSNNEFWMRLNIMFPHFKRFEELANEKSVTRFLINFRDNKLEESPDFLELFLKLGLNDEQIKNSERSKIKCYVVEQEDLEAANVDYLVSDHIIYQCKKKHLLATYDFDVKSLIVTYEESDTFSYRIILDHFNANKGCYVPIEKFIVKHSNKVQSHLHEKYNLASKLPSIIKQRELQANKITTINPKKMLSIGIGHGDEINFFIERLKEKYASTNSLGNLKLIQWIDPHNKAGQNLQDFSSHVKIEKIETSNNLLDISVEDEWDCIQ